MRAKRGLLQKGQNKEAEQLGREAGGTGRAGGGLESAPLSAGMRGALTLGPESLPSLLCGAFPTKQKVAFSLLLLN